MLLDFETLDLLPRAREVVAAAGDERFKLELPAAQLELASPPRATVSEAVAALAAGRRDLATAAAAGRPARRRRRAPVRRPARRAQRGRPLRARPEYGDIARRQLVCALQVHVAVGGADRSLAVYNALRPWLPALAALGGERAVPRRGRHGPGLHPPEDRRAAAAPGRCRPRSPRGRRSPTRCAGARRRRCARARRWWWEARPHPAYGTLEVRVPDAQATVRDAAAIAAVVARARRLARRPPRRGRARRRRATWRIEENRWSAARGASTRGLADLRTGERDARARALAALLGELAPVAARLGCAAELAARRGARGRGGAQRQRAPPRRAAPRAVAASADAYVPGSRSRPAAAG